MSTKFTNEFSEEVWKTTYKYHEDNTVDDTLRRVSRAIASVEKTEELKKEWEEKFYEMLSDFKITAAGRIYSNAGTEFKGTTLINCFVGPRPAEDIDSLDGILKVLRDQAQTLKSEGGWGMNFSFIRPRGSFIYGIGVETPGSVKYMEIFDKSSEIVTAGSGLKSKNKKAKGKIRKGAMMGILDIWHPDVEEFITAKQTPGRLTKFNMSVNCSDEFMAKVSSIRDKIKIGELKVEDLESYEEDKWDLVFPETTFEKYKEEWDGNIKLWKDKGYPFNVYKTVSAYQLWETIMSSTYNRNEPGVLFLDNANRTHCWNYGGSKSWIATTNPCGEQSLPFGGCCNLLSINLVEYFDLKTRTFDFEKLEKYVRMATRFADNVNDYSNAPLPEYMESLRKRRRIGMGVMGWGSLLYLMKMCFASKEAEEFKAKLMKIVTHSVVDQSVELAIEKGMFDGCDPKKHESSVFWDMIDLPEETRSKMRKNGIRNSALFSIQPTGNTSIFANIVSGGCEPLFMSEYIRTCIVPTTPDHILDVTPKFWQGELYETSMFKFEKEGDDQILKGVDQNGVVYKIDGNRGLTKEILCEDYAVKILKGLGEWDETADWACTTISLSSQDHITDMKGWYRWIDSSISKTVNIPNEYPYEEFKDIYIDMYSSKIAKGLTTYRAGTMATVLNTVENKNESNDNQQKDKIVKTQAVKRPLELEANIHHAVVKGVPYYVVVGMIGNDPYEIFTGENSKIRGEHNLHDLFIPKKIDKGLVTKKRRSAYELTCENFSCILNNGHSDDNADALTRMISTALRHGADISFIVHQLEKTQGELISFAKALARTLKKYIPDGTQVSGEKCPECNSELIRYEGCIKCKSCMYNKCS